MADIIYTKEGRTALQTLWHQYLSLSEKYALPFMATTPTRRANKERVSCAGYDKSIIRDNVQFLRRIKNSANGEMYIGGLLGCKGDAYTGKGALSLEQSEEFHEWQVNLFREAQVDFLYAGMMPTLPEDTGLSIAMAKARIPYIISFTIQKNGTLVDGHTSSYLSFAE